MHHETLMIMIIKGVVIGEKGILIVGLSPPFRNIIRSSRSLSAPPCKLACLCKWKGLSVRLDGCSDALLMHVCQQFLCSAALWHNLRTYLGCQLNQASCGL